MRSMVEGALVRAPVLTFKRARTLRRKMTLPEVLLWEKIRGGRLGGLRFRRQHPTGPYILDFYCPAAGLAVEVDGTVHESAQQTKHDARRDRWLSDNGVRVLRIPATDILNDERMEGVLRNIARAAALSTAFGGPPPPLRR
ncbi:MAG TPA: endonuclease domain-containing protein [Rhizomicrobium sp.]